MALLQVKENVRIKSTVFTKKKLEYWVKFLKKLWVKCVFLSLIIKTGSPV